MAHGYRTLQHWDQWLVNQALGQRLIEIQQNALSCSLNKHYGKHALLIGVPGQCNLLNAVTMPCHTILSPLAPHDSETGYLEGDLRELPIATGSVDLVLLPHTLEFLENPHRLLNEACRVVKPEGLLVILGFNPYSLWGARKMMSRQNNTPWAEHFIQPGVIKQWLQLADFHLEEHRSLMFRPPVNKEGVYDKLGFLETVGKYMLPALGGVYMVIARAKVIPLTPIRLKWKQRLSNIRISTSATGYTHNT